MTNEKTERELMAAVDFAAANTFLSGLPINAERVARYKAMIQGGITTENFLKAIEEDRKKILQGMKNGGSATG